jgi:RAD54-like protein 2
LNLIEEFLKKRGIIQSPNSFFEWRRNQTYFRFDGSTSGADREKLINQFNADPSIRLFLISTRAGSLGVNLVAASRVIIFDASWNP